MNWRLGSQMWQPGPTSLNLNRMQNFLMWQEVELPQKPCDSTALLRLPVVPCLKALSTATALRHQGNSTPAANSSARHTALQKAAALYGESMAHTALPLVHADGIISIATGDKRVPLLSQIHSSVRQLADISERLGGAKAGILQEAVAAGSAQGSWGLVLGLEAPGGSPSSILDVCIAKLAPGRMLACARSKLWWMTPEWRSSTRSLPPEIQFLLVEVQPGGQGPYALLLPLIDGDFRATLRPAE
ncbi:hypothetical protein QJQ45_012347 [Haematococcus lacustris]|nr:hypothetical protein QJQ45_012347 [Haematococcus lacustris]